MLSNVNVCWRWGDACTRDERAAYRLPPGEGALTEIIFHERKVCCHVLTFRKKKSLLSARSSLSTRTHTRAPAPCRHRPKPPAIVNLSLFPSTG